MSTSAAPAAAGLDDAAFGRNPGLWPLPPAMTPRELWLRAVAAGGQGRYGSALADLDRLHRAVAHGPIASLALSTRASFLRQLGWHDRARSVDGRALALAQGAATPAADALIGLAADALGVGRFAASARALQRAADLVTASPWPRLPVRYVWVSAELAMVRGDGASAVGHAERAVELASSLGSERHTVKSRVILAAAHCSSGDIDASRRAADDALRQAGSFGLIPLRWATACLLADIGSDELSHAEITALRDASAETVIRQGGVWRSR
jgi:tetratricopeptide (TPR) repeat protein